MPHSSGGGSHHGGSHHSSHHSSSHSGHSGSSSRPRTVRTTYFVGSRRYVRYRNHQPEYIYADYDVTGKSSKVATTITLFILCFFALLGIIMISSAMKGPSKLKGNYGNPGIEDHLGIFDGNDETRILNSLRDFKEETGITPYVITVFNEEWEDNYYGLENYAYDLYVNMFPDEGHWLIVYSQQMNAEYDSFVDWYWEGMQGDDTDDIISASMADDFTDLLQKYLTASSRYDVAEAIANAFDETTPKAMKRRMTEDSGGVAMMGGIMIVYVLIYAFGLIKSNAETNKYKDYVKCPEAAEVREIVCDYCSGVYVKGTVTSCPHCGAPVRVMNGN